MTRMFLMMDGYECGYKMGQVREALVWSSILNRYALGWLSVAYYVLYIHNTVFAKLTESKDR